MNKPTPNLLVLRCRNLALSRAFYETLGLNFIEHAHNGGPTHFASESDHFVFELYPAPPSDYVDQTGLGFTVDDLRLLHVSLSTESFKPGPIKQNPWGLTFVVRDPDGRRVELKQRQSN